MRLNVHFYTRQAAREANAARIALTESARDRHLSMAGRYQALADEIASRSTSLQGGE